jgi:hypothetical protein
MFHHCCFIRGRSVNLVLDYQLYVIYPQSLCALLLTESEDKGKAIPVGAWTGP